MREVQSSARGALGLVREAMSRGAAPTLADRVVNWFDPVAGARRMQARAQQSVFSGIAGGYIGGKRTRRATQEWQTTLSGSADSDLLPDLAVMRDRSRDLARNSPLAAGAINTVVTSVVGTGLALQARINAGALGLTPEEAGVWQKRTELEFRLWCESAECDVTRTQNFYELQDLVFRATLESGDAVTLLPFVKRPGQLYGLKLQVIEADRLSNPNTAMMNTPSMAAGVELDTAGAPVAYHILRQHPGDMLVKSREWDRYPAFGEKTGRRNVLHHFRRLRPGQNRGAPYLAPVIEPLKQLDRYSEAEIMAAVVAGLFTVFVHSEGPGLDLANQQAMGKETGAASTDTDAKLGNGAIIDLGLNEKIDTANPGRPNSEFDPFVQAVLRQIGVALELPFEVLIKHFTASYSAARAALLEAWRFFRVRRDWLAGSFCQPVYETWLAEAVASGRIAAPGFFADPLLRMAWCGAQWQGDGPGAIDPTKEADAAGKRMELGLTTLAKETAAYDGSDWEDNHAQSVREKAARMAGGLESPVEDPNAAASETPQPDPALAQMAGGMERMADAIAAQKPPQVVFGEGAIAVKVEAPQVRVEPAQVTFADGAIRAEVHPTQVTIAEGAVQVAPAQVTIAPAEVNVTVEADTRDTLTTYERDTKTKELTASRTRRT